MHPKYREDIDGLRAIAVLSVVIFHAFPSALPGGFIGVDVFFVISGFLISTIIFSEIEKKTFRFSDFYSRRIRRIFPALILTLITTWVIGWAILNADELRQLGVHMIGAATFTSNLILFSEVGYFDTSAATKPLLHLWSLGIEEQFYLLFPVAIWLGRSKKVILIAILLSTSLSFLLSILAHRANPSAAFYLPQFRFWELLAGSLLAYGTGPLYGAKECIRNVTSIAGAALLVAGGIYTEEASFPGWFALIPVAGSVLIIGSGPRAIFNRTVLSIKPLVLIGLISYPLYLWHWPFISYARIITGSQPPSSLAAYAVAASFLFAALTYIWVERPIRLLIPKPHVVLASCAILLTMGAFGGGAIIFSGFPQRSAVELNTSFAINPGTDPSVFRHCSLPAQVAGNFRACSEDSRGPYSVALLGDSKAQAAYPGFFLSSTSNHRWIFLGGAGGADFPRGPVLPSISDEELIRPSDTVSSIAVETVASQPGIKTVVFMNAVRNFFPINNDTYEFNYGDQQAQDSFVHLYINTAKRLARSGKNVVYVVDIPTRPDPRDCTTRNTGLIYVDRLMHAMKEVGNSRCYLSLKDHQAKMRVYRRLLDSVADSNPNVTIFDVTDIMCDQVFGECPQTKNGMSLYSYADHVSDYAATLIGASLLRKIGEVELRQRSGEARSLGD